MSNHVTGSLVSAATAIPPAQIGVRQVGFSWHRPADPLPSGREPLGFLPPQVFRVETASTICPRDCPLALAWRERRMRRFERSWSSSSFSALRGPEGTGCDRWFRGTRAGSRHQDTGSSAIRKSARATSPESVYSQPSLATSGAGQEGTAWAARPSPKLDDPHPGRDRPDGHHGEKSPGPRWRPLDPVVGQSHEAANRKRFLRGAASALPCLANRIRSGKSKITLCIGFRSS
jgi:hypothetical protein